VNTVYTLVWIWSSQCLLQHGINIGSYPNRSSRISWIAKQTTPKAEEMVMSKRSIGMEQWEINKRKGFGAQWMGFSQPTVLKQPFRFCTYNQSGQRPDLLNGLQFQTNLAHLQINEQQQSQSQNPQQGYSLKNSLKKQLPTEQCNEVDDVHFDEFRWHHRIANPVINERVCASGSRGFQRRFASQAQFEKADT